MSQRNSTGTQSDIKDKTMYAYFDHTAPQPAPILGWIEGNTPYSKTLDTRDLLPLSQEQWDGRFDTPYIDNGVLIPEPIKTQEQLLLIANAQLKASAQIALNATDLVAFRCFKAGVPYPTAWQDYALALRNIVTGVDMASTSLPSKPAYPSGT
jgi:hypothetical protein